MENSEHDPVAARGNCPSCGGHSVSNCPDCATAGSSSPFIYALGKVEPRFPRPSVEKELAQVAKTAPTEGLTNSQVMRNLLGERSNRYLVRQLCWVFTIEDQETYVLLPRDPSDWDLLAASLRPVPRPTDLDALIGIRGATASAAMCNGLTLPVVNFDQLYAFDRDSLIKSISHAKESKQVEPAAEELLDRILRMANNAGATDEHRALNYLAVRYPAIYIHTAAALQRDSALSGVGVRPSGLGTRNILDVVFSYRNRNTDVQEKYLVRVDVTDEFPFLVTKMSPYYDR
jgi:hypothetical protein